MGRPNKPRWRPYAGGGGAWVTKVGGKLVTLASGAREATRAAARRRFHEVMAARGQAGPAAAPALSLNALCEAFMDDAQRRLRPLTYEFYLRHVGSFLGHQGRSFAAADVRPFHVAAWLDAHPGWGPTTRAGAVTAVKRLFRWAKQLRHLDADELADMEKPAARPREAVLTPGQSAAVLRAYPAGDPFRDLLEALHESGCRPSEAAALEAGMIDWGEGVAVLASKTTGATGRRRVIYLTPRLRELLRPLAALRPDGPVLRNARGRPWTRNAMACRFARLRKRLGLGPGATAESYRHGFATDGLEAGVPIATVAELLGHTSTRMVERHYSKLRERKAHLRDAAGKVRPGGSGAGGGAGPT